MSDFRETLTDLATMDWPSLQDELIGIAARSARALDVTRVSIWRYDDTRSVMRCHLFWKAGQVLPENLELSARTTPRYWDAVHAGRTLTVADAATSPVLAELHDGYLVPEAIGALLDSGIRVRGKALGIVCMEQVGRPRQWTVAEEDFVASIADRIGVALLLDEERRVSAQLHMAQRMESLGLLAGGIAHDFNNYLNVILLNCELALANGDAETPHRAEFLDIADTAKRARSLTQKLLTVARCDAVLPEEFDVGEALNALRPLLDRAAPAGVVIRLTRLSHALRICCDPSFFDQIVLNLVTNAIHAMPQGGTVSIETAVVTEAGAAAVRGIPTSRPGTEVPFARIRFTDTGSGIPRESLARIFEPFFTTKGEHGTGLGLSVIYGGLRQHGGYITVESEPGRGTTFDVFLPLVEEPVKTS